jgi:Sec-independent protein translocase protein TatA
MRNNRRDLKVLGGNPMRNPTGSKRVRNAADDAAALGGGFKRLARHVERQVLKDETRQAVGEFFESQEDERKELQSLWDEWNDLDECFREESWDPFDYDLTL